MSRDLWPEIHSLEFASYSEAQKARDLFENIQEAMRKQCAEIARRVLERELPDGARLRNLIAVMTKSIREGKCE